MKFSGKSFEQLMQEGIQLLADGSSTNSDKTQHIAQHQVEIAQARHQSTLFSGDEVTLVSTDYYYEQKKLEREREYREEINRQNRHNEEMHRLQTAVKVDQQVIDTLKHSVSQAHETVASHSHTSSPAIYTSLSTQTEQLATQEVQKALKKVSLSAWQYSAPIEPSQHDVAIPSQVKFKSEWFNSLPKLFKKAIFMQEWADLPEASKTELQNNPMTFLKYFPNFDDTMTEIRGHKPDPIAFLLSINEHIRNDFANFPNYFTSLLDETPSTETSAHQTHSDSADFPSVHEFHIASEGLDSDYYHHTDSVL